MTAANATPPGGLPGVPTFNWTRPPLGVSHTFIGSAPGSGSTILGSALNGHPHCVSTLELGLFHSIPGALSDSAKASVQKGYAFNEGAINGGIGGLLPESVDTILQVEGTYGLIRQIAKHRNLRPLAICDKHPGLTPWLADLPLHWSGLRLIFLGRYPMGVMASCKRKLDANPSWEPGINWGAHLPEDLHGLPRMERAAYQVAGAIRGLVLARGMWPLLELDYDALCGPDGWDTLDACWRWMGLPVPPVIRGVAEPGLKKLVAQGAARVHAWKDEVEHADLREWDRLLTEFGITYDRDPLLDVLG